MNESIGLIEILTIFIAIHSQNACWDLPTTHISSPFNISIIHIYLLERTCGAQSDIHQTRFIHLFIQPSHLIFDIFKRKLMLCSGRFCGFFTAFYCFKTQELYMDGEMIIESKKGKRNKAHAISIVLLWCSELLNA